MQVFVYVLLKSQTLSPDNIVNISHIEFFELGYAHNKGTVRRPNNIYKIKKKMTL